MITWVDWGIWAIYLAVIYVALWFYRHSKTDDIYKWFLKGFLIKVFGGVAFALVFVYYYKFGDSFEYFKGASMLANTFLESPSDYFQLLFHESSDNFPGHLRQYTDPLAYSDTPEEWFMVKLVSVISLVSFNSYLVINLIMSLISFWGGWKLFKVFKSLLPTKNQLAFVSAFLIPSMVFWGSGLMKDTLTLTGINYLIYVLYFGVIQSELSIKFLFGFLFWFFVTFTLKSYIILAFIPTTVLVFYFKYKSGIKSDFLRSISAPLIFILFIGLAVISLRELSTSSQKYSTEQLEWKVKGFHSWHTTLGGSAYNLGEVDYTPIGVLSKLPASLNVTFFRPYLWEARNPVVFLGALESTMVFLLFVMTLYKSKFRLVKYLKESILIKSLLVFIIVFGFAVGFTSYNFGALGRYKMPVMSIMVFTLIFILNKIKKEQAKKSI